MKIKRGSTSVRRLIFIADSSSTTGAGLANLTYNSSGLVAYYFAGDLSNEVQITLATATLGTYTSGGFVAVDNTNMPGWYEIGIPDAALDGGNECVIQLRGATNMVPVNVYIELDAVDYQVDALGAVKPTTAGRTLTVDTSGNVVLQDGSLTATKIATDAITAAKIASDAVAEIQAGLSTLDAASVRTALGLASANIDTQLAGINAKTANLPADPADASDIASSFSTVNSTLATIAGYIDTEVAAIKAKTDNLPTDPADASDIAAAFATANSTLATIAGYLDTEIAAIKAKTDTLPDSPASETTLSALSGKLAGITLLKNWLALIMGKTADTATRAEVNATTAGATFNETTDSLEAQQDAGGGGGGGTDWTANERTAIKAILGIPSSGTTPADPTTGILDTIRDQVVANGTALAGTPISANSRVASGGTITAYIGDDFRVRSDTELSLSVSDVGGALYTKWSALGASALIFGASREGTEVGAISGTVASIASVGSGSSQTCKLTVEISSCGTGLKPGSYEYQIEQRQTQGSDTDSFVEVAGTLTLKRNSVA